MRWLSKGVHGDNPNGSAAGQKDGGVSGNEDGQAAHKTECGSA